MAARNEKGCHEKSTPKCLLVCKKGLSNDDVRVARGTVFQEIRLGAGFRTGDLVKEEGVGGATTVGRLYLSQKCFRSFVRSRPLYFATNNNNRRTPTEIVIGELYGSSSLLGIIISEEYSCGQETEILWAML